MIDAAATTTAPGAGRSYLIVGLDDATAEIAARVGRSYAAAGARCLVIDANGEQPPADDLGLSAWLLSPSKGGLPDLPAADLTTIRLDGWNGEQDLMRTDRWRSALEQIGQSHPVALIAVRPISVSADALALARIVTGTLLVVSTGRSDGSHLLQARAAVESAGGTVLGVILG